MARVSCTAAHGCPGVTFPCSSDQRQAAQTCQRHQSYNTVFWRVISLLHHFSKYTQPRRTLLSCTCLAFSLHLKKLYTLCIYSNPQTNPTVDCKRVHASATFASVCSICFCVAFLQLTVLMFFVRIYWLGLKEERVL